MTRFVRLLFFSMVLLFAGAASAQVPEPPPLAKDLDTLAGWLAAQKTGKCTERCFVLTKLELGGSVATGTFTFTLEGSVLATHPVAVPLFGPPNKVRIEKVMDGTQPAAVGFEGDHYFVFTGNKRFVITGKLMLDGDLALAIPGPLNTLEANLDAGRVVEGARLAGLANTTIHFDGGAANKSNEPTVFQLSRAFRVQREVGFEYRLVLRSGADLGVVRLPLANGERVLEVVGSTGWKVEGPDLVLPTAGRTASITITGTIAEAPKTLAPDPRSAYEWWLLESDAEHRIGATGTAHQLDSTESPIPRTQPTGRLFLAKRGESLAVTIQTLTSIEALAAVIREHHRTMVLTARGDWVIDEVLVYENNGVDYLLHDVAGRPIFLATDGVAERILMREAHAGEVMVALRKGQHAARLQSLADAKLSSFGGILSVPLSQHPLPESRATLDLGLPAGVHPVALLGGDRPHWFIDDETFVALGVAALVGFFAMRQRRDRLLLGLALAGTWFVLRPLFVGLVGAIFFAALFRIVGHATKGRVRTFARVGMVGIAVLSTVVFFTARRFAALRGPGFDQGVVEVSNEDRLEVDSRYRMLIAPKEQHFPSKYDPTLANGTDATANFAAQLATGGVMAGVTPVALPLPSATHWARTTRELVTKERPFAPRLVYVTTFALAPFALLWLGSIVALLVLHRARLAELRDKLRASLAPPIAPEVEPPPAPAE